MTLANSPSAMAEETLAIVVAGCSVKDYFSRQWLAEGGHASILRIRPVHPACVVRRVSTTLSRSSLHPPH